MRWPHKRKLTAKLYTFEPTNWIYSVTHISCSLRCEANAISYTKICDRQIFFFRSIFKHSFGLLGGHFRNCRSNWFSCHFFRFVLFRKQIKTIENFPSFYVDSNEKTLGLRFLVFIVYHIWRERFETNSREIELFICDRVRVRGIRCLIWINSCFFFSS